MFCPTANWNFFGRALLDRCRQQAAFSANTFHWFSAESCLKLWKSPARWARVGQNSEILRVGEQLNSGKIEDGKKRLIEGPKT